LSCDDEEHSRPHANDVEGYPLLVTGNGVPPVVDNEVDRDVDLTDEHSSIHDNDVECEPAIVIADGVPPVLIPNVLPRHPYPDPFALDLGKTKFVYLFEFGSVVSAMDSIDNTDELSCKMNRLFLPPPSLNIVCRHCQALSPSPLMLMWHEQSGCKSF
jgi:hypothetical protein